MPYCVAVDHVLKVFRVLQVREIEQNLKVLELLGVFNLRRTHEDTNHSHTLSHELNRITCHTTRQLQTLAERTACIQRTVRV